MTYENEPVAAASLLERAQILHDEHVASAEKYKEKVMAEADETVARMVAETEEECQKMLGSLEDQKSSLLAEIDTLRTIEAEYRQTLTETLNGFLAQVQTVDTEEAVETDVETLDPVVVDEVTEEVYNNEEDYVENDDESNPEIVEETIELEEADTE